MSQEAGFLRVRGTLPFIYGDISHNVEGTMFNSDVRTK